MSPLENVPTLQTERLILRCPQESDMHAYIEFYSDAEASHFYGGPLSEIGAWSALAKNIGHWVLRGFGLWTIVRRDTNEVIGSCGLAAPQGWPRRELTWWILPEARKQGFAKEASLATIQFGYEQLGWDLVETHMDDKNVAARALTLSLGGKKIARELFPDGQSRDIFQFPDKQEV